MAGFHPTANIKDNPAFNRVVVVNSSRTPPGRLPTPDRRGAAAPVFESLLNLEDLIDEIELEAGLDPVELPAEPLLGETSFVPFSRDLDSVSFPRTDEGRL